jgi:hypothetical protein
MMFTIEFFRIRKEDNARAMLDRITHIASDLESAKVKVTYRKDHSDLALDESCRRDVRFTPESGHWLSVLGCPLCANSGHLRRSWILLMVSGGAQIRGASL